MKRSRKNLASLFKKILIAILFLLPFSSYSQRGDWKPFKLLVIQPDTAIVFESLSAQTDSIVGSNLKAYYTSLRQMEEILSMKDYPEDMKQSIKESQRRLEKEIPLIKAREDQVKRFKFYHTISQYSTTIYNLYFNEYEPYSTILEIPDKKTDWETIRTLADSSKADFVVFYNNIHSIESNGLPILKLTTSLFSRKENRIILNKETEGDTGSRGDMWTCNMEVPLSCLLINGVRTSTSEVATAIMEMQSKKK
jgi:hypothetical protein